MTISRLLAALAMIAACACTREGTDTSALDLGSARVAVVNFVDTPNPTTFKVLLFDTNGVRVSGDFDYTARGY